MRNTAVVAASGSLARSANDKRAARRYVAAVGALLLIALAAPAKEAASYGDVAVGVESEPRGDNRHGYSAFVFTVANRSRDRAHRVTLTLPRDSYADFGDYIRSISRTVEVAPESTVRVAMLVPFFPPVLGNNLRVAIDDRNQDTPVALGRISGGSVGRGPRGYSSMGGGGEPLVLISREVEAKHNAVLVGIKGFVALQVLSAEVPVASWVTTWLGYSRYDAVVLTGDELAAAPAGVQTALWQFAETGGSLLILGTASVPDPWKKRKSDAAGLAVYATGLGTVLVCDEGQDPAWPAQRSMVLANNWVEASNNPWHQVNNATTANNALRVVDDVSIPVGGLFTLMLLFTLVIGPLNLWLLGRKGRRLWMLWTVPSISFVTCLAVFGYMLLVEGWQGHLRTEALTILDENSHRATTLGYTGFYAPMTPGDGLHFSPDSEVIWQKWEDYSYRRGGSSAACTIDWSQDQHFASGWVSARTPSHFKLRKSETRRERLGLHRRPDGSLEAVNGLGAAIHQLWVADEKGQVHTAEEVAAGATAPLTRRGDLPNVKQNVPPLRRLTQASLWMPPPTFTSPGGMSGGRGATMKAPAPMKSAPPMMDPFGMGGAPLAGGGPTANPAGFLAPRSYVAVLEGAPFVEEALRNARTRKGRNIVLGILKDNDDGN